MERVYKYIEELIVRYPILKGIKKNIEEAFREFTSVYENGGKIIVAGNGGSAADAEHLMCELMKGFLIERQLDEEFSTALKHVDNSIGDHLSKVLQKPLPVIALGSHVAFSTAYINDVESDSLFAQQLLGMGKKGDAFIGISTSGNSRNIIEAAVLAKALGLTVIALTGMDGGKLKSFADVIVQVPENKTYIIQEYHLPIYHCWCMMLEEYFFGD